MSPLLNFPAMRHTTQYFESSSRTRKRENGAYGRKWYSLTFFLIIAFTFCNFYDVVAGRDLRGFNQALNIWWKMYYSYVCIRHRRDALRLVNSTSSTFFWIIQNPLDVCRSRKTLVFPYSRNPHMIPTSSRWLVLARELLWTRGICHYLTWIWMNADKLTPNMPFHFYSKETFPLHKRCTLWIGYKPLYGIECYQQHKLRYIS